MPRAPKAPPGPTTVAVAHILNEKMEAAGLNKSELARRSGMTRTTASDIIRGLQTPDIEQLAAICEALGLDWVVVLRQAEQALTE